MTNWLIDYGLTFSLVLLLQLLLNIMIVLFLIIKGISSLNKDEKQGLGLYIKKNDFDEWIIICVGGISLIMASNIIIIGSYVNFVEEMTKIFLFSYFPLLFVFLLGTYFITEKVRGFPDQLRLENNLPLGKFIIIGMCALLPFFVIIDIIFFDYFTFLLSLLIIITSSLGFVLILSSSVQRRWYLTPQDEILVRSKFWFSKLIWEEKQLGKEIITIKVARNKRNPIERGSLVLYYNEGPMTLLTFSNTNQLVLFALFFAERFNVSNSDIEVEGAEIKRLLGRETFYPQDPTEVRQIEPCNEFLEGIDNFRPFKRISNDPDITEIARIDPTKQEYSSLIIAPFLILLSISILTGVIIGEFVFGKNLTAEMLIMPFWTVVFIFYFLKFVFGRKVVCFNNEYLDVGYSLFNHIKFELRIPLELILNIQVDKKSIYEVTINFHIFDFVIGRYKSKESALALSCFIKSHILLNESTAGINSMNITTKNYERK